MTKVKSWSSVFGVSFRILPSADAMGSAAKLVKTRAQSLWSRVSAELPGRLLQLFALPYNRALKRNTIDAIDAIIKTSDEDTYQKDALVRRFLRFKINEIKYVQVAVSSLPLLFIFLSQKEESLLTSRLLH